LFQGRYLFLLNSLQLFHSPQLTTTFPEATAQPNTPQGTEEVMQISFAIPRGAKDRS
jgi:hypothetical protein